MEEALKLNESEDFISGITEKLIKCFISKDFEISEPLIGILLSNKLLNAYRYISNKCWKNIFD